MFFISCFINNSLSMFRLGNTPEYEDMDPRKQTFDNKDIPKSYHGQYRRRSSTFPGACGGNLLATNLLSIYSFREQGILPVPACYHDMEKGETSINYESAQHYQANSGHWKKRPSQSRNSHKISAKVKMLLNIALFLLAAITGKICKTIEIFQSVS